MFPDLEGTEFRDFIQSGLGQSGGDAAELPDQRLDQRLATIVVDAIERPDASIPQASGSAGQAKATYRFYSNARVTAAALHQGFAVDTALRCLDQDVLLVVQDTTTLNFTTLHTVEELGPIDSGGLARGVHLHTTLAVTVSGQVVGILDQQYWARPQPGQPEPQEKESDKWIHGIDASRAVLYQAAGDRPVPRLIHLMDREGDAYEVMMAVVDAGDSAIIRCAQNRRVDDPLAKAQEAVRSRPVLGRAAIAVPRKGSIPERRALVQVRSSRVWLTPDLDKYPHAWPMTGNLVEVWEPEPPPGTERIHWLLWTREPAAHASEALEVVRKYTCRWPIEEVHLVLKSGCRVEALRLKTVGATEEGGDRGLGCRGANRVVGRPGAGDARGAGVAGVDRGRGGSFGLSFRQRDEAVGADNRPSRALDRPPGRAPESQAGRDAGSEDVVAWPSRSDPACSGLPCRIIVGQETTRNDQR